MVPAAILLASLVAVMAKSKIHATTFWMMAVLVTPPWIYPMISGFRIPVAAIVSLCVVVAYLGKTETRWTTADNLVVALSAAAVVAYAVGGTPLHVMTQALLEWVSCYAAGRLLFDRSTFPKVAARAALVLAVLAIAQSLLGFNLADLPGLSHAVGQDYWMSLQTRGGFTRAELTLGHSIALGATLALLLPFVMTHRPKSWSTIRISVVLAGIAATFSRGSAAAAALTVAIGVFFLPMSRRARVLLALSVPLLTVAALSFYSSVSNSAVYGQEISQSSDYRGQLTTLFNIPRWVGMAPGSSLAPDGSGLTWGTFTSIDNAVLYVALYLGVVAAILYVAVMLWVVRRSWNQQRGFRDPYVLALASQIPLLITVAPITQYQSLFWLLSGLAVSSVSETTPTNRKDDRGLRRRPSKHTRVCWTP